MTKKITLLIVCVAVSLPLFAENKVSKRLADSTTVLKTILDKQEIPQAVMDKAVCVLVYPGVKKVAVGIGGTYGRGVLSCRTGNEMTGAWSAPSMYTLDTGSLGVQLGSTSTDYVLFVMTTRGANKVLTGKLKLGADANATAGPSTANAAGFNDPNVDILAYSQAKGLFAGVSLGSASMETDNDANKELYGKEIDATQIVRDGAAPVPAAGKSLVDELNKMSPMRK
ncbi:MAG TPA: lipid-binding SYLF domain-containing protein [Terriglobales bacterium]|jgi:lipid-binding SYLF domain-containing protein